MTSINEIFRSFAPEYLERYANLMPKTHRKAIDALMACRTEACGLARYQCETCAASHEFYRSIPISITSSPAGRCPPPMAAGIPPESISICPSKRSPKSFGPSSAMK
ncbi:MAG: transposase zinc-binding domain-containing protein [Candidatus Binatia bacterium]|nr:transposase zinc-binding domain-containing protein [Candidatus Binatia bacterium]